MSKSFASNSRRLCLSASVLAIVAASASAQTTTLTPSSSNYDLISHAGTDQYVELSSGTDGYLIRGDSYGYSNAGSPVATVPTGGVALLYTIGGGWQNGIGSTGSGSSSLGWFYVPSNAPVIKVDSGATLSVVGKEVTGSNENFYFYSMFQAAGEVKFGEGTWVLWGADSFTNVTLLNNASLRSGGSYVAWGCCGSSAATTVSGWFAGASTSSFEVSTGSVTMNGVNTAAHAFTGTMNVTSGGTFTVGDSTHASAVFGDPTGKTASINVAGGVLNGYGTIDGNVTNSGVIQSGGVSGVNGGLTINGNLTLTNNSILKTSMSPTGVNGLTVNGNLVASGEMDINVASGDYGNGVYPLLVVNGGAISGAFNRVLTTGSVGDVITGLMQTSGGFTVVTEKGTSPQVFGHVVYANRMAVTNFVGSLYDAMAMTPATGAKVDTWITPIVEFENISRDGQGYEQKSYGINAGAMHRFERHGGVVGVAASYRRGDMSVKNSDATARTDAFDFAVYGGADVNSVRYDGSAFYDIFSADTNRPMGTFGDPKASQNGYVYGVSGQISRDILHSLLTPYVRGMYARNHLEAGKESGSLQFALQHDAVNANTVVVDLGLRAHVLNPEPGRLIKVDAGLAWRYDLSDPGETVNVGFANFVGGTNTYFWRGDSKHAVVADVDVAGQVTDELEIYSRLGGTLTSHRRAGELSAGVKYRF